MYLFHLLRSFLPLQNPIGFGASDYIEFIVALLLVLLLFARALVEPAAQRLARRPVWCMLFLFALVILLRLALLPMHPVPTPYGADDFSYILLGDTLSHFRLANPTHPMFRFFETTFVLHQPAYSSIYAIGQGAVLAFGQLLFGVPWVGVLVSMAAISALCYWMLRGWTSPGWALVGGLLAVCQFGPLNIWMNSYWGGAVTVIAGCLVYGALGRLRERVAARDAVLLGAGLGLQMLCRPYESVFLAGSIALFFLPYVWRQERRPRIAKIAVPALAALLPAAVLVAVQNKVVTGTWTTLPYALSQSQYGVPQTLTFQPIAVPTVKLTPAQQLYFEGQAAVHGPTDTIGRYLQRLGSRAGFYRFFLPAPLFLALPFFVPLLRQYRYVWLALSCLLFAFGTTFYAYFFPQYVGALASVFILISILSLQRLAEVKVRDWPGGETAARWLLILSGAQFLFWYGIQTQPDERILRAMVPYESADAVNFGDPDGRIAINRRLAAEPGGQLVFVRYFSSHGYKEWIHNAANIDKANVVWALDLGRTENDKLKSYFPDRKVWLMEPDAMPPRLSPYPVNSTWPFEDVH
jgi:hypothetical protein